MAALAGENRPISSQDGAAGGPQLAELLCACRCFALPQIGIGEQRDQRRHCGLAAPQERLLLRTPAGSSGGWRQLSRPALTTSVSTGASLRIGGCVARADAPQGRWNAGLFGEIALAGRGLIQDHRLADAKGRTSRVDGVC